MEDSLNIAETLIIANSLNMEEEPSATATIVHNDIVNTVVTSNIFTDNVWCTRIQGKGCVKDMLPKKTYMQSHITSVGPDGEQLFYHGLSCIAIDLVKIMSEQNELGLGWTKIPKNKSDVKKKIVTRIIGSMKMDAAGTYILDQKIFLSMLQNVWGDNAVDTAPHHNDRVRLFGIIMTHPEFRDIYQKLAEGVTNRHALDDPALHYAKMFQILAFAFNNESIVLALPQDAYDLPLIEEINPNDPERIRIIRDGK